MKMITLVNSFHNTEVKFRQRDWMVGESRTTWDYIQYRADNPFYKNHISVKRLRDRIKKKLCGVKNCVCGTVRY